MQRNKILLQCFSIFSLLLVSCNGGKRKVNFFYFSESDSFVSSLASTLVSKFKPEYEIKTHYANNTQSIQNNQIVDALNEGSDLLVVNICDRLAASTIIEKASLTKTPIIFTNREPLLSDIKSQPNIYYVGTDPIFEGSEQAIIADSYFGGAENFKNSRFDKNGDGKLQVYLLKGELGHQDTELRSKYCKLKLQELGYDVEILQTTNADWEREKAALEFSKSYDGLLDNFGNSRIELLLSNNDSMALGVSDYLRHLDDYNYDVSITTQYFPIIGVDGTDLGVTAIVNGFMYGTVKNDSNKQASAIYDLADIILNNKSLNNFEYTIDNERFIHIEGEPITETTLINDKD